MHKPPLVEDSNTFAKLFQVQLQLLGHTVTLARDQATALAAFKSEVFGSNLSIWVWKER
ncbi:MAG: hypothetical protein U0401_13755 [Anaerolineae bacterium]